MPKLRKYWSAVSLRYEAELGIEIDKACERTRKNEQEVLREAIRLGLPLVEDKTAI